MHASKQACSRTIVVKRTQYIGAMCGTRADVRYAGMGEVRADTDSRLEWEGYGRAKRVRQPSAELYTVCFPYDYDRCWITMADPIDSAL